MRIRRIRIDSFGGIKNRDYHVDQNIQAFYGLNESGKTSTMEFIRSTLVPSKRKKEYPIRNKTDNGVLDVIEDEKVVSIRMEGKNPEGNDLRCVDGLDPELYRSVFAMDAHTLDDSKIITQGDLKTRFLTIPGGERLPETKSWVDKQEKEVIGIRSTSPSRLKKINEEIDELDEEISKKRSFASEYGTKSEELKELEIQKSTLLESSKNEMLEKEIHDNYENNRANYQTLITLKQERDKLGTFVQVTDEDIVRRNALRDALNKSQGMYDSAKRQLDIARNSLNGIDSRTITSNSQRIDQLPGKLEVYERQRSQLTSIPRTVSTPEPKVQNTSNGIGLVALLGLFLVALGVVACLMTDMKLISISVIGTVIAAYGLLHRRRQPVRKEPVSRQDDRREMLEKDIKAFEDEVRSIADSLGIQSYNIAQTVTDLKELRENNSSISRLQISEMDSKGKLAEARNNMLMFYQRFSGEDGFEICKQKTKVARDLDTRISATRDAISASGLDPDIPECPVKWTDSGIQESISELDQRIGELRKELNDILDMRDLESMLDKRAELLAEKDSILREGGVAVIASGIIDHACQRAYNTVQPSVIRTADRYLKGMTNWSCSVDLNPETGDISVGSTDGAKGENMWSSGLRAQVLLSIKLAIAKEMGQGEIPVVLDDVLLPFDSERKRNCIEALMEISKEMQIIMFTCDSETCRFCEELGIPLQNML